MGKAWERFQGLMRRAWQEQAAPHQIGLAIGLGVLLGTSPLLGLHALIAVPLASLLRLNRLLAVIGTNISIGPLMGVFVTSELVIGSRLLGRPLPALSSEHIVDTATGALGAWWVGYGLVGPLTALLVGSLAFAAARRRDARRGTP